MFGWPMLDPSDGRICVTTARIRRSRHLIDRSFAILAVTETYVARTSELLRRSTDQLALTSIESWDRGIARIGWAAR